MRCNKCKDVPLTHGSERVKCEIGEVVPYGDSAIDRVRLNNLQALTNLTEDLVHKIAEVLKYEDRHEYSIKQSCNMARKSLEDIRFFIESSQNQNQ